MLKLGDISSNIQGSTVLLFHIFLPPSAQLLTSQSADEKSSSTIETVAYILLAHVSKPDLLPNEASVSKLVRWLSAQRNAFGGFASTQVTKQGKSWGSCCAWTYVHISHVHVTLDPFFADKGI